MITAATLATPMALFTRRSRSGWLDELDDIRGDALAQPDGEVALAMGDADPLPEVAEDRSPLADLEARLAPARVAPSDGTDGHRSADRSHDEPPPLAAELLRPPTSVEPPAPVASPASPMASTLPPPPPPVDRTGPRLPSPASELAPPPATPSISELPPPPASWPAADEPLSPPSTQPAPHPIRPHEMWHPAVVPAPPASLPPVPSAAEEHVDPAELDESEPEVTTSRFRFARLRPVLPLSEAAPEGGAEAPTTNGAGNEADPPAYSLIEELLAPYGVPSAEIDPETVGHGTAPYVPAVTPVAGSTLINGPVNRRTQRDDEFVRRRELNGGRPSGRVARRAAVEPPEAPAAPSPAPSDHSAPSDIAEQPPVAEMPEAPTSPAATADHPTPEPGDTGTGSTGPSGAPAAAAADAEPPVAAEAEPAPEPAAPQVLTVGSDGTVDVEAGHLRLADEVRPEVVLDADGVSLTLVEGWCWTVLGDGHPTGPVVVTMPAGTLTVPAGTTALAVVEADRTSFVVVVAGEASLAHPGGRLRLRPGAMALAPLGVEPQVDVATEDEIHADPLVGRNLRLDAAG